MSKLHKLILALVLLGVEGCSLRALKLDVERAPSYNYKGTPSSSFYEELASRTSEMAPEGVIPSDPQEAWDKAMAEIESRGIRIVPKAGGVDKWERATTTFPNTIYVAKNWDSMSLEHQAEVLWHELVHVREYQAHSELNMGVMYFIAEGRWALEAQAFRESFRVKRTFGMSETVIRNLMQDRAERMYEFYDLQTMPRDYAISKAIEIWMLDSK